MGLDGWMNGWLDEVGCPPPYWYAELILCCIIFLMEHHHTQQGYVSVAG